MTLPTERELTDSIIEAAHVYGWLVHHDRPARTNTGWATAIQGDQGFPDLVLSHPIHKVTAFSEVKGVRGRFGPGQPEWMDSLATASAYHMLVWRPIAWQDGSILKFLANPPKL